MVERDQIVIYADPSDRTKLKRDAKAAGFTNVSAYLRQLAGLPQKKRGRPPGAKNKPKPPATPPRKQ